MRTNKSERLIPISLSSLGEKPTTTTQVETLVLAGRCITVAQVGRMVHIGSGSACYITYNGLHMMKVAARWVAVWSPDYQELLPNAPLRIRDEVQKKTMKIRGLCSREVPTVRRAFV